MRTLFLALATFATIFATGVTPVAASEYRYCLQGYDYAGGGDCGFTSYQQCQASASGRMAYCEANPYLAAANPYLANAAVLTIPARHVVADPRASRANQMAWSAVHLQ